MNSYLLRRAEFFLLLAAVFVQGTLSSPRAAYAQVISAYAPQQLQQLVAPIAIYPDALLGEVLMASTYPMEVIDAAQWRNANPGTSGDYLTAALTVKPWDPSVKGLTAFPQVLQMMSNNLEWTERVGEAFLADQRGVMDAVQQLRRQAQASGSLYTNQQQAVSLQDGAIIIQPADPAMVYVPYYDPATVFTPWPYPDYTPYAFTAPSGVVYVSNGLFGYTTGIFIVNALWGWDNWNWREHRIDLDDRRWRNLDNDRPPANEGHWGFDPDHRRGVPFKDAAVRERFEHEDRDKPHPFRGFDNDRGISAGGSNEQHGHFNIAQPQINQPGQTPVPQVRRGMMPPEQIKQPEARQPEVRQPEIRQPEIRQPETRAPQAPRIAPPIFESFAPGYQVKTEAERGSFSHTHGQPETRAPQPEAKRPEPARNNSPDNFRKDDRR